MTQVTIRNSFGPDVTMDVNLFFAKAVVQKQVDEVLKAWTLVTGLAWGKMDFTSHVDGADVCVQVEHPLDNRGKTSFMWKGE